MIANKTDSSSLPVDFVHRLRQLVPVGTLEAVLRSFGEEKKVCVRVNTLKSAIEHVKHALQQKGFSPQPLEWFPGAFLLDADDRSPIMDTRLYKDGILYLQNPSSLLSPVVLDPKPGEEVLDLAAAPGSKTLQMAGMMRDEGRIAAVEAIKARFFKLKANVAAHDAKCIHCYLADGRHLWRKVPERFDRVLLDAPCSSESRFRQADPQSFAHWSERKIKEMARKQKQLLYSAVHCLKPGGVLVYSTCSFSPEENEAVVNRTLEKFCGVINIEEIPRTLDNAAPGLRHWRRRTYDTGLARAIRILPDKTFDGFFICRLRKMASSAAMIPGTGTKGRR